MNELHEKPIKKCTRCRVTVTDSTDYCPLCHSLLENADGAKWDYPYPPIHIDEKQYSFLSRLFILIAFVASTVSVLLNIVLYEGMLWSAITVAGVLYLWSLIFYAVLHHVNAAAKIIVQTLTGSALVLIIDYVTGFSAWSSNYVIPSLFILANLSIVIVILCNRLHWRQYILYQIGSTILGFVPLILYFCGIADQLLLVSLSACTSICTFAGSLLFGDQTYRSELKRRFHI